ncbi:Oidioi.mRNA.OKI2018_I69.PAR.g10183.t1.cds [Oikopleura dioica]|uniref:Oidioi.mRNA.OKI2018_I69.PAR.g10183.t1.cds n=1 Tax=Oikopleura dioica TaxID=34765 RepID=A0ABN7RPB2_OIKDI|nr:Oidioi.mRNA.OKI2018_I69.PAR.g10183.t1.cds [Oikopleura dioica]
MGNKQPSEKIQDQSTIETSMASENESPALRVEAPDDPLLETASVKIEITDDGRMAAKFCRAFAENAQESKHSRLHEEIKRKQQESAPLSGRSSRVSSDQCGATSCSNRVSVGTKSNSIIQINPPELSLFQHISKSKCLYSLLLLLLFPPTGAIALYWSIKSIRYSKENKKHLALDKADLACIINIVGAWNV